MKLSKIMHVVSALVGLVGVVMFVGAMGVDANGTIYGVPKFYAMLYVIVLILIAIWIQIATIHHMMLEKNNELI